MRLFFKSAMILHRRPGSVGVDSDLRVCQGGGIWVQKEEELTLTSILTVSSSKGVSEPMQLPIAQSNKVVPRLS